MVLEEKKALTTWVHECRTRLTVIGKLHKEIAIWACLLTCDCEILDLYSEGAARHFRSLEHEHAWHQRESGGVVIFPTLSLLHWSILERGVVLWMFAKSQRSFEQHYCCCHFLVRFLSHHTFRRPTCLETRSDCRRLSAEVYFLLFSDDIPHGYLLNIMRKIWKNWWAFLKMCKVSILFFIKTCSNFFSVIRGHLTQSIFFPLLFVRHSIFLKHSAFFCLFL